MQGIAEQCDKRNATRTSQLDSDISEGSVAYLTVKSSRQKRVLMSGPERGPNALRPISLYDLNFASSMIKCASIFALQKTAISKAVMQTEHPYSRVTGYKSVEDHKCHSTYPSCIGEGKGLG